MGVRNEQGRVSDGGNGTTPHHLMNRQDRTPVASPVPDVSAEELRRNKTFVLKSFLEELQRSYGKICEGSFRRPGVTVTDSGWQHCAENSCILGGTRNASEQMFLHHKGAFTSALFALCYILCTCLHFERGSFSFQWRS